MWLRYLLFFHNYVTSKIETKEKMEEKVKMRLKWLIDGEIEFKFEWCKGIFSSLYKQFLLFERSEEIDKSKVSKTCKSAIKALKTESGKKFWIVLMMQQGSMPEIF